MSRIERERCLRVTWRSLTEVSRDHNFKSKFAGGAGAVSYGGTFDIYVVVDTREVKLKKNRCYIQEQLESFGVRTLTRSLTVGDFLWIAKSQEDGQEIVLDYVIERKTMDDLVASIKDSRFKDQKLRLGNCGLRNRIYLVESSHSMARALDFGITAIRTALTQVQVVHGFFLKQTRSLDETIRYLVKLTRNLANKYTYQNLNVIPTQNVSKETFSQVQTEMEHQHSCSIHITFESYQFLNNKSKDFKVREVWTRQLMSVNGVSVEKAVAMAKTFPTMKSLLNALGDCETEDEQEHTIRNAGGIGRKAIGSALARRILQVTSLFAY